MEKRAIRTTGAPAPVGPYSQAVQVDGLIFCSGQLPMDPVDGSFVTGDIREETRRVLENLTAVLKEGGSSLERVIKTTVFLTDLADFPAMNEVYGTYFHAMPPARSTIQVAALPRGARIEIECIACIGG